jgi:hypothetical protein
MGLYDYKIRTWNDKAIEGAKLRCLKDEVGLVRMMIQQILDQCDSADALLGHGSLISELVARCERLVTSSQKLDYMLGKMVDKDTLLQLADKLVDIITEYIPPENLEAATARINDALIDAEKASMERAASE